jgi:energy-coupling factor transporter transmembrane protein EcfT
MILPVIFVLAGFVLLLLLLSFRIHIELIATDSGITYTISGNIMKVVKIYEVKSGSGDKDKKMRKAGGKDKDTIRKRLLGVIKEAITEQRGKIFHIEKLSVDGTFSIEDAAANALLYGLFLTLWQFLLIFLSANFTLEHQKYNFMPDFRNDRNEFIFHAIFRVVIIRMLLLVIHSLIESRKKKTEQS